MQLQELAKLLSKQRFSLNTEKELQAQLLFFFNNNKIVHAREYFLDEASRPDFLVDDGIAVEVKIKGRKRDIYKQIYRYSEHPEVKAILLISSVSMGKVILYEDKPLHILNLSMAWL